MADTTDNWSDIHKDREYEHSPSVYDPEEPYTFKDGFLEWLPLMGFALVIAIPLYIWVDPAAAWIILGFSAYFFGARVSVPPKDRFPF